MVSCNILCIFNVTESVVMYMCILVFYSYFKYIWYLFFYYILCIAFKLVKRWICKLAYFFLFHSFWNSCMALKIFCCLVFFFFYKFVWLLGKFSRRGGQIKKLLNIFNPFDLFKLAEMSFLNIFSFWFLHMNVMQLVCIVYI